MWDNEFPYPNPEAGLAYGVTLGFTPAAGHVVFDTQVMRTLTEWDSHYLRFTYRNIVMVAELNIDSMPYVEIQHDRPCRALGFNEMHRGFTSICAQTGREEAVNVSRKFSIDSSELVPWSTYLNSQDGEPLVTFGEALLGLGLAKDQYVRASEEVMQALRDVTLNPRAVWWPVWNARC